jgi:hypothetical protein
MTKVPTVGYEKVVRALQRDGWVVVVKKALIFDCINISLLEP